MSEEELNIKYIRHKLGVDMLLAKEKLKLCSERYIEGIEQGKFDRLMLEQENQQLKERIRILTEHPIMSKFHKPFMIEEIRKDIFEYTITRNGNKIRINEGGFEYLINLEKVLDEIREYIDKFPCIHYSSVEKVDGKRLSGKLIPIDDLLQILDKVKE